MTSDNVALQKSYSFSKGIVKLNQRLRAQNEYVISKQILRSGTSIGSNIVEANGAQSRAEFRTKIHIAYREAKETEYWLSLLNDTRQISTELWTNLSDQLKQIIRILGKTLATVRK